MRRENLYAAYQNAVPQPCSSDILYFLSLVAETLRTFGVLMLLAKILRDRKATGNGFGRASVGIADTSRAADHESSASLA